MYNCLHFESTLGVLLKVVTELIMCGLAVRLTPKCDPPYPKVRSALPQNVARLTSKCGPPYPKMWPSEISRTVSHFSVNCATPPL
jgi:hypothetical protein